MYYGYKSYVSYLCLKISLFMDCHCHFFLSFFFF